MNLNVLILAITTAIISGCATPLDYKTGTEVSQEQLDVLAPGKATQKNVVTAIGHPNRKEALNGKEMWYYDYNKVGAMFDNVSESTVFEWDEQGNLLASYKTGKSGKTGNALIDAANNQ